MGILYLIAAYTLYGFSDAAAPVAYKLGSNVYNLAFLNNLLAIPFIWIVLRQRGGTLRLPRKALLSSILIGILAAATTLTLNLSILMIGAGMATMLHMSHTLVAAFGEAAILKQRPRLITIFTLVVVIIGILCMTASRDNAVTIAGVAVAILSGIGYGCIMLTAGYSEARTLSPLQVQFYAMLVASVILGLYNILTGRFALKGITLPAWGIHLFCALAQNFLGFLFVQQGIRKAGAAAGSLLGSLEPVVSAVLGAILLSQHMSHLQIIGCAVIIAGVSAEPLYSLRAMNDRRAA